MTRNRYVGAQPCGCDPDCGEGYTCSEYPDCAWGASVMERLNMEDHGRETGFGRPLPGVKPNSGCSPMGSVPPSWGPLQGECGTATCGTATPLRLSPDPMLGPGGAPTRVTTLPDDSTTRKEYPVASGVLDYFPDAIVAVAHVSWQGNNQHNPGQPLHWARGKSGDHADAMLRHFGARGTIDTDRIAHSAKMAWRALALLQEEIEAEQRLKRKAVISEQEYKAQMALVNELARREENLLLDPHPAGPVGAAIESAYITKRPRRVEFGGVLVDTLYLTDVEFKQQAEQIMQHAQASHDFEAKSAVEKHGPASGCGACAQVSKEDRDRRAALRDY